MRLALLALAAPVLLAAAPARFEGELRLPSALRTPAGELLEAGSVRCSVEERDGALVLLLSRGEKVIATLKPEAAEPAGPPLTGTQFLRATQDKLGTADERHFSKTGKSQYEEEERPWRAALRVFGGTQPESVVLELRVRSEAGWTVQRYLLRRAAQ